MPAPRRFRPYRPPTNDTRSSRASRRFDREDAEPLGLRRAFSQVAHDLYGTKDVQDAITASYVWMADQIGHLTLGLVPTLLLSWIWDGIWARWICAGCASGEGWRILGLISLAALVFAYWCYKEATDYRDTKRRAGRVFFFDSGDILWNVKTALLYFGIGGLLAIAAFIGWWVLLVALALVLWPALRVAFWWLRRKLAFQQAGLPYLYRLANFTSPLGDRATETVIDIANLENRKILLSRVCFGRDEVKARSPAIRHILLTGPLGAGKTSLAVGIGTEFAFALGIGRYLSAAKLVELAADREALPAEMDYDDGRVLWPWTACDLLIVDDVDAGVATAGTATHLVDPADLEAALTAAAGEAPLEWLGGRRSVWVLGDASAAPAWKKVIARLMSIGEDQIMTIELPPRPPPAAASAPEATAHRPAMP